MKLSHSSHRISCARHDSPSCKLDIKRVISRNAARTLEGGRLGILSFKDLFSNTTNPFVFPPIFPYNELFFFNTFHPFQRGGAHLGSITITGAQIGRQQRTERQTANDDEKEYRHAFLIVEAKKGPGGSHPRHVLCAESDEERDAWVEMLVRYFTGMYSEEPLNYGGAAAAASASASGSSSSTTAAGVQQPLPQSQPQHHHYQQHHPPHRGASKDELSISKGAAIPISQLAQDPTNAKFFSTPNNLDEYNMEGSPVERAASSQSSNQGHNQAQAQQQHQQQTPPNQSNVTARRVLERLQGLPSSLPDSSPLSSAAPGGAGGAFQAEIVGQRPNSEMGHYSGTGTGTEMIIDKKKLAAMSPERHRNDGRKSYHPAPQNSNNSSSSNINGNNTANGGADRSASPDKSDATSGGTRVKISGPLNGTPIPAGFRFGKEKEKEKEKEKDKEEDKEKEKGGNPPAGSDRRDRTRSRFWPGWRANGVYLQKKNLFVSVTLSSTFSSLLFKQPAIKQPQQHRERYSGFHWMIPSRWRNCVTCPRLCSEQLNTLKRSEPIRRREFIG